MLSLDDVLSIRHPEGPEWSPDGATIAFAYTVDGVREVWTAATGDGAAGTPHRASKTGLTVSAFGWLEHGRLAYASGAELYACRPEASADGGDAMEHPEVLVSGKAAIVAVACAPARVCLTRADGGLLILEGGPRLREPSLPGKPAGRCVWSADGTRLAVPIRDGRRRDVIVLDADSGETIWSSAAAESEGGPAFVGSDRLTFVRVAADSTWVEFVLAPLDGGGERVMERMESACGLSLSVEPAASRDGGAAAYTLAVDGWPHLVVHDLRTGTRTVALPGAHEDLGHEAEVPVFSPDGRSIAFSSSKGALQQRQIWRYDLDDGRVSQLTDERGTHTDPAWSPDGRSIAAVFCGPYSSAELTVLEAGGGGAPRRLTHSMPMAWTRDAIAEPTHVLLTSADGMRIHADLWLPKGGVPAGERVPGLVYVHGGPMRQMRDGWHPMHAYGVFYAFNQYLVSRGYAVISVDYRGGTGYGASYEQANYLAMGSRDMEDCIAAAQHLGSLPQVDPARLAIWGLSYGGYMTLAAMTKRPEVFALGINIAGLWDMEQWARWMDQQHEGAPSFTQRLGGPLGAGGDAEAHRHASPRNFLEGLSAPLLNLHGTADAQVDFAQLDEIVRDCTEAGKDFAALYYPDESHMFTKRTTWQDAFRRIEDAFDRYLRCDPARRPRAMI